MKKWLSFITLQLIPKFNKANVSYLFKGWRYVSAMDPNIGNISMSLIKTDQVNNNNGEKIEKFTFFNTHGLELATWKSSSAMGHFYRFFYK
jgi:hypothetical protein